MSNRILCVALWGCRRARNRFQSMGPRILSATASFRQRSPLTIQVSTTSWRSHGFNVQDRDDPSVKQRDLSAEFAKRVTEDFAVSLTPTWTKIYAPGGPNMTGANGFQNLETLFKYRVYKNPEHEFVLSAGLSIEWGGSGAQGVGAERFTVYTPTLYFGKGFGDLPSSLNWARPFAITGQFGYAIPSTPSTTTASIDPDTGDQSIDTEFHPRVFTWGGSLQYSMPYLKVRRCRSRPAGFLQ